MDKRCWELSNGKYLCELLPSCGCFDPKDAYQYILSRCDAGAYMSSHHHQMVLLILDDRRLIEHGTAIRGSFLTTFGDEVLAAMREHWGPDPKEDPTDGG